MINSPELREQCAAKLEAAAGTAGSLSAFVGLDGFVDEIIHVVDKRENVDTFSRLPTIARFAERLAAAAGKSTNVELVNRLTKLGGNGPIMANALASFGIKVTYIGTLGYPNLHPIFSDFAKRAEVHTIAEPGHTDALEFEDGKVMMGKHVPLAEVTWPNIQARFGRDKFIAKFNSADMVGFVNWTMLPFMSDVWESLLQEVCPDLPDTKRWLFFDLADPEKRTFNDISRALELISRFEKYFNVILGLNEKEAYEIGKVMGITPKPHTPEGLAAVAMDINRRVNVHSVVVHPVSYALTVTGAGDHFNSGFCLGRLLGLEPAMCVLTGVSTSGFYVRTAKSPTIPDLVDLLRNWPAK
jgi:hypothetical protein